MNQSRNWWPTIFAISVALANANMIISAVDGHWGLAGVNLLLAIVNSSLFWDSLNWQ